LQRSFTPTKEIQQGVRSSFKFLLSESSTWYNNVFTGNDGVIVTGPREIGSTGRPAQLTIGNREAVFRSIGSVPSNMWMVPRQSVLGVSRAIHVNVTNLSTAKRKKRKHVGIFLRRNMAPVPSAKFIRCSLLQQPIRRPLVREAESSSKKTLELKEVSFSFLSTNCNRVRLQMRKK